MFELPVFSLSQHVRAGGSQLLSESIATFGLLLVVARATEPALAVGAYIAAAYWFTASTSFANPAVTMARALTDTFAGIRPADVGGFVAAQIAGAAVATALGTWMGGKR
jgi:glycerol uptake facilitator-like aquaporin